MRRQLETWQKSELTDVTAKVVIYEAFVEGKLGAPRHLPEPCMTSISSRYALQSVMVLMQGVLLRGVCL